MNRIEIQNSFFPRLRGAIRVLKNAQLQAIESASKDIVLSNCPVSVPNVAVPCRPALFDPTQFGRVLACGFKSTLEEEFEKLRAHSFFEAPRAEYLVRDAFIAGGRIYTQANQYLLSQSSPFRALKSELKSYKTATLLNSEQGLKYFGHWLRDDCAVYEEVKHASSLLSLKRPDWPDASIYENAFQQHWPEVSFAHIGELSLHRELGFSRDKARRLRVLRDRLRKLWAAPNAGRIVYLRRGQKGEARDISNQDELEAALSSADVHIVEPELRGQNVVRELLDAEIIITVEGSQASHGVYCLADKGGLLILQPPERFYNPHHEWTRLLGMNYGITIGQKSSTGFHIYPDEVLHMIDRLRSAARA